VLYYYNSAVIDIAVVATGRIYYEYIFFAPSNGKSPFGHTHTYLYACKRQKLGIGPRARTRTRTMYIYYYKHTHAHASTHKHTHTCAYKACVHSYTHTQTLSARVRGVGSVKWTQERRTAAGQGGGAKEEVKRWRWQRDKRPRWRRG